MDNVAEAITSPLDKPQNLKTDNKKDTNINQIPNIQKNNLNSKSNNEKKSKSDILVSPPDQHVPDNIKYPVILVNKGKIIVDVNPQNKDIAAKILLPQTKCFMIPDFLKKKPPTKNHCSKCVNRFKELGNDFIKMAITNLISKLPYSSDIQRIPLQCTKCNSEKDLV